jgi:AmmeMemoRadiSam system protein A
MSDYDDKQREALLQVAAASIRHGLDYGQPLSVDTSEYGEDLRQPRACFVTLEIQGALRGCIGSLQATRPLVEDVAQNAYAAAFQDPRFPPLRAAEYSQLHMDISVLQPAVPMEVSDEADLLRQLRPGMDGLILEEGGARATFLPSVWEQLPTAGEFLAHLKMKAGLSSSYWSHSIHFRRYTTEAFGATVEALGEEQV